MAKIFYFEVFQPHFTANIISAIKAKSKKTAAFGLM
jgi:hypothetical protein